MQYKIGELADRAGVPVQTIRYYERRGLIPEPPRRESGYRQYSPDYVNRIRFIKKAQQLGFSLEEIAELLALRIKSSESCDEVKSHIDIKLNAIEEKILALQSIGRALEELRTLCDLREPSSECPVLEILTSQQVDLQIERQVEHET